MDKCNFLIALVKWDHFLQPDDVSLMHTLPVHTTEAFTKQWNVFINFHDVCSLQTNTFQCILTTDGVQSFALLQYGEMRWGPGRREHHDALIGYMDGKSTHKEPTTPPGNIFGSGGRYRPQQVKGPLGRFGKLVYDLSGPHESEADPGLMCQAWAMKEPDPADWTDGLPSCHCTRAQALEDFSFLQDTAEQGSQLKMLRGQRWGGNGGQVFRSFFANKYGSGKRCVYDLQGPLLAGYNERYFSRQSTQKHIGNACHCILGKECIQCLLFGGKKKHI